MSATALWIEFSAYMLSGSVAVVMILWAAWGLLREQIAARHRIEDQVPMVRIRLDNQQQRLNDLRSRNEELKRDYDFLVNTMAAVGYTEEHCFLIAIRERPREPGPLLIYADWLQSQDRDDEALDMRKRAARLTNPKLFVKPEKVMR